MDRKTHCPNCFQEPVPAPVCHHCGFDAKNYSEATHLLPLFTPLDKGKYIIGRVLSEAGGFSIVYGGFQQRLKRRVVIKEFFPHQSNNALVERLKNRKTVNARPHCEQAFSTWKARFFREADTLSNLSRLNNPRIVQVFDVFEENNTGYLVMEYLEGCTLSEYLDLRQTENRLKANHPLSSDEVLSLLEAALDALEALHGHNPPVIHRDLTPHNLFLVSRNPEQLKVLDFGLAQFGEGTATSTTLGVGTPAFASPEQMSKDFVPITPATDFYTLGASLYTALVGVTPPTAMQRHNGAPMRSLSSLEGVDNTLAAIIRDCLEMDPNRRPRDVAEIRRRLAARTVLPPVEPKSVTLPEPTPQPVTPIQPVISPSTTEPASKLKVSKSKSKPKKPQVEPKTPNQADQPKRRYRNLLIAIPIAVFVGGVGLLINQAQKFSPANPTADVSPAPPTQALTRPPLSEIQTPTVAPAGEPASPEEKPSLPEESPVAGVNTATSSQAIQPPRTKTIVVDYAEVVEWQRKAAEQGDPEAQYMLGNIYAEGLGITQDNKQAVEWFRKAAEQRHKDAQYKLGTMY